MYKGTGFHVNADKASQVFIVLETMLVGLDWGKHKKYITWSLPFKVN